MYGHIYKKTQAKCVPLMKAVMDFLCLSSTTPNCQDLYYRAGFILTKNPVARKDSNFISVVPIVILSSLCFYCTC